jgi:hypothetical protein
LKGFGFGFGFRLQYCRPVVGTLLPAKTWAPATVLSAFIRTVRFRSIRAKDCAARQLLINNWE